MGILKRLDFDDLGRRELDLLEEVVGNALDELTLEELLEAVIMGRLAIWAVGKDGLIGLSRTNAKKPGERGVLWVEFIVGNVYKHRVEIVKLFREVAEGRVVEALPHRPGMIEVMRRLGFQPVAQKMRLTDA